MLVLLRQFATRSRGACQEKNAPAKRLCAASLRRLLAAFRFRSSVGEIESDARVFLFVANGCDEGRHVPQLCALVIRVGGVQRSGNHKLEIVPSHLRKLVRADGWFQGDEVLVLYTGALGEDLPPAVFARSARAEQRQESATFIHPPPPQKVERHVGLRWS